jgi:hypothetical protein
VYFTKFDTGMKMISIEKKIYSPALRQQVAKSAAVNPSSEADLDKHYLDNSF